MFTVLCNAVCVPFPLDLPHPQIDRLVALLETPCFTFLRLQLLEPRRVPSLLRALYGLLMLLPQCNAFRMLNTRLQVGAHGGVVDVVEEAVAGKGRGKTCCCRRRSARPLARRTRGCRWARVVVRAVALTWLAAASRQW